MSDAPGRRGLVGVPQIVYVAPKKLAAQAGFELGPVAAEMHDLLRSADRLRAARGHPRR